MKALLKRHGEVSTPFGLSLSKPVLSIVKWLIHPSTSSGRTGFNHCFIESIIAILLLCLITPAHALELVGVKLDDKARVENTTLQLNGAGIRTKVIFKVYVGALYLGEKKRTADAVLADVGAKRVALHMLRELSSEQLLEAFEKGMAANHAPAEMTALDARLKEFFAVFRTMKEVEKGDVITLDYLPDAGTRISVNGVEKGRVEGAEFNRALLKIWLGDKPVDGDLKKGMLGG